MTLADTEVIFRWAHGALSITGWGWFYLAVLALILRK